MLYFLNNAISISSGELLNIGSLKLNQGIYLSSPLPKVIEFFIKYKHIREKNPNK